MIERPLAAPSGHAALAALLLFLVSLVALIVSDPRKDLPEKFAKEHVEYLPIGATFLPRIDGFKQMLGVYNQNQTYADKEKRFLIYDFFFLLVYGLAGAVILAYLLPAGWPRWLVLVPILAALFDAVENVTMYVCLGRDPKQYLGLLTVSRLATSLKWVLLVTDLILLIICGAQLAWPAAAKLFGRART